MFTSFFLASALGYLLGSISFSYHAGKLLKGIDLREHGSGNLGSTNTIRILGKKPGIAVQILDILKGLVSLLIARQLLAQTHLPDGLRIYILIAAGCASVMGHMFPFYLKFKGGKGVNTSLGVFLYLAPVATLTALGIFLLVYKLTGYVSAGSLSAALGLPLIIAAQKYWFAQPVSLPLLCFAGIIALLIVLMHRSNISRLLSHEENTLNISQKQL
ncbi:MAG: glycerol-3-phosphate 1-O-acyltransferase PlsY [bacterium]